MGVNAALRFAVENLTKNWSKAGSVEILMWDEYVRREHAPYAVNESYADFLKSRRIDFMPGTDCIVVSYDWMEDDLSEDELKRFWVALEMFWTALRMQPGELHNQDGSGNGLIYGLLVFKP